MIQRLTALTFLAAVVAPLPATGRELDRRTAIRMALAQNPQIAAARAEEAAMQAQARQADAARWPMVNVLGGVGPSVKATLVPGTAVDSIERQRDLSTSDLSAVFLASVTAVQPLWTFGKIAYRREATEHGVRARQAQTRMTRADVAMEVARIYEGYLLARDAWRFFDETTHWLDKTLQSTQDKLAKHATGVTERDVLRVQTAISLAIMGRNRAQAGQAQAQAGLIAYLGLNRGTTLTFAEDELLPVGRPGLDFERLVALAQQNRPELVALREGNQALSALSRAEAVGLAPDLFLLGFVELAYTPGRDWLQTRYVIDPLNHVVPGVLLGLRWQFWGNMAAARAEEQRQRANVLAQMGRWAEFGIPAQVRQAFEDVQRARKNLDEGDQGLAKAKRWMVQASADNAIGLLPLRDLFDAVEAYVTLRLAGLDARFDHNVGMAALSRATGTLDGDSDQFYMAPPQAADKETP